MRNDDVNTDILNFYKKVRKAKLEGFAITSANMPRVIDKEVLAIDDENYTVYKTDAHGYIVPGSSESFSTLKEALDILVDRLLTRKEMQSKSAKNTEDNKEFILNVY